MWHMTNPSVWLTGDSEADRLLAEDDNALLIGMILDQQVPMEKAFSGPLVIAQRMGGTLDVAEIAASDEEEFVAMCSRPPAIHRFPGSMAERVQQLARLVEGEYGGDASRLWNEAADGADLRKRIAALPGFGEMKIKALGSVLAKRFGVEAAQELVPNHPTLGDVDSPEALERYQAAKREYKAKLRSQG